MFLRAEFALKIVFCNLAAIDCPSKRERDNLDTNCKQKYSKYLFFGTTFHYVSTEYLDTLHPNDI